MANDGFCQNFLPTLSNTFKPNWLQLTGDIGALNVYFCYIYNNLMACFREAYSLGNDGNPLCISLSLSRVRTQGDWCNYRDARSVAGKALPAVVTRADSSDYCRFDSHSGSRLVKPPFPYNDLDNCRSRILRLVLQHLLRMRSNWLYGRTSRLQWISA